MAYLCCGICGSVEAPLGDDVQGPGENTEGSIEMATRIFIIFSMLLLACGELACAGEQITLTVGGTGSGLGVMRLLGQSYSTLHPEVAITVLPSLGSSGGIRALKAGAIDLAISSRLLEKNEKSGVKGYLLGMSPFVFVVHPETQVQDVTINQLADIYNGTITTWPDGVQVRRVLRPVADTDWQLMRNISPELAKAMDIAQNTKGLFLAVTDTDTLSYLERVHGSIGPSTLAMILAEKRNVNILSLDGIKPGVIHSGKRYPLEKPYIILVEDPVSQAVGDFIDFILSDQGRIMLAKVGITASGGQVNVQ